MLGIFPAADGSAATEVRNSCESSASSSPTADGSVLSRLDEVQRAQTQQAAVMRSLESCISDMVRASRPSRDYREMSSISLAADATAASADADASVHAATMPARVPIPAPQPHASSPQPHVGRGQHRKESWTWDPQVQGDLEQSFELFRSMRKHKVKTGDSPLNPRRRFSMMRSKSSSSLARLKKAVSPSASPELLRRHPSTKKTSPDGTPQPGSLRAMTIMPGNDLEGVDGPSAQSMGSDHGAEAPLTASGIISRWAHAKKLRFTANIGGSSRDVSRTLKALIGQKKSARSSKSVIERLRSSPSSRMLRSSWLFRQRVAGRLSRRDARRQPCGALCSLPLCRIVPHVPPDALLGLIFDKVSTIAVAYIATFTPLQVAFYSRFDAMPWHLTNLIIETLFIVDVGLRFRRGFNHDGVQIKDPHFIALHYFRGEFFTDAIASFPCAATLSSLPQPLSTWLF